MSNKVKSSNFNQALWLSIGQLGTIAITFISAAILSRYLDKEDYGTYKQILYIYSTLMAIFTVGLPSVFSYFIPRLNTNQQKTLIDSLNKVFLGLGALFSLTVFLLSDTIANLLKNPELSTGLKIFSIFPLFTLPTLGVEGIYTALRKTKQIAIYHILTRSIMVLCIVLPIILYKPDYKLAVIGWGVASFITFLFAMYLKSKPYLNTQKEFIPNMYKSIFSYSLPLMGAFIAGFFISSADQFFISRYYGTEAFADYSNGSLSIPIVAIVAASIKKVLIPIFSKADFDNKINDAVQTYVNAVTKSVTLVFPFIVYALFFAKDIVMFVYGSKYENSASYLRYYLIRDFLTILPYFSVFLALGMSRVYLKMHIIGALYVWLFGFIVVKSGLDASMIVMVRTMFYVGCTIFAMIYLYKKRQINLIPKKIVNQIFVVLIHSSICAYIVFELFRHIGISNVPLLLTLIVSFVVFYIIVVITGFILKVNYSESAFRMLKIKK